MALNPLYRIHNLIARLYFSSLSVSCCSKARSPFVLKHTTSYTANKSGISYL